MILDELHVPSQADRFPGEPEKPAAEHAGLADPQEPAAALHAGRDGQRDGDRPGDGLGFRPAQLSAALKLGLPAFPLPPLDLGKLDAMAYVAGMTGANSLHANASLSLQRMATSINVNLPSIMQMLMELMQPLIEPLMDLLALLHSFEAVHDGVRRQSGAAGGHAAAERGAGRPREPADGGQSERPGRHESGQLRPR